MLKIKNIEENIIGKLTDMSGENTTFNFSSYEETFVVIQDQINAVEKDFLAVKERLNADYQTAVDLCKRTREDYIVRMKEIYDEQMSTVNDTKRVIETLKSKTEAMVGDLKDEMDAERTKRKEFIVKIKEETERTVKQL